MNEKVTQMVSLLFRDVALSDEVQALHDEVLNNCQDRFADLLDSGLSEEESLAAVMESLKGMEEVLKEYPRADEKQEAPAAEKPAELPEEAEEGPSLAHFNPEDIRAVDVQVSACDIEVTETEDGSCSLETEGDVHMKLEEDGTLRIWQDRISDNILEGISWEKSLESFERFGDALNQLGKNLSSLFTRGLNLAGDPCRASIRLPRTSHPDARIRTTSGDIRWEGTVPGNVFSLKTTSGDVNARVAADYLLPRAEIATMSGDAGLRLNAENARISSVSGDITWEGDAGILEMNTTSGDAETKGAFREIRMNTTSGDLDLELTEAGKTDIAVQSVSGDISVRLPADVRTISAGLKSVSGDIRRRGVEIAEDAPVRVDAKTVSGDLKICN